MAGTLQSISVGPGNTFSLRRPTYVDTVPLSTTPYFYLLTTAGSSAGAVTHVLMSGTVNFAVAYLASSVGTSVGSTVIVMNTTTPTTDGGGNEINPTMREVKGVAYIGFLGQSTGQGSISSWVP